MSYKEKNKNWRRNISSFSLFINSLLSFKQVKTIYTRIFCNGGKDYGPRKTHLRRLEMSALSLLIVLLCRIIFSSMHARSRPLADCVFLKKKKNNARSFHDLFTIDFVKNIFFSFLSFSSLRASSKSIAPIRAFHKQSARVIKNERASLKNALLLRSFVFSFLIFFSSPSLYPSFFPFDLCSV